MITKRFRFLALAAVALLAFAGATDSAVAKKKSKKSKEPGAVIVAQNTQSVASGESVAPIALCPLGTTVVGGGFRVTPDPEIGLSPVVVSSQPVGSTAWQVSAGKVGGTGSSTVTVEAYCRANAPQITTVTASGIAPVSPDPSTPATATVTATCPPGTTALSAGFTGFSDPATTQVIIPVTSRRSADGQSWTFNVAAIVMQATPISMQVLCVPAKKSSERPVEVAGTSQPLVSGPVPEGVVGDALTASCPTVKVKKKSKKKGKGKASFAKKKKKKTKKVQTTPLGLGFTNPGFVFAPTPNANVTLSLSRTDSGGKLTVAHTGTTPQASQVFAYCSI